MVCELEAGKPEPPGAQVPDDGGDQQREDHGEAGAGADLQNQLDRQQRDDGEGHRAGGDEHAGQVAQARPDHGDIRIERMGVDDRGDGVGGVVEAVDELEAQRDQQGQRQQHIGPDAGDGDVVRSWPHGTRCSRGRRPGPEERWLWPRGFGDSFSLRSSRDSRGMELQRRLQGRPSEISNGRRKFPSASASMTKLNGIKKANKKEMDCGRRLKGRINWRP